MTERKCLLDYLLANSGVAAVLEPPVTLEELLGSICETPEQFEKAVALLKCLPQLETDRPKFSNCLLYGEAPYDALRKIPWDDVKLLCEYADYLDLKKAHAKIKFAMGYGPKYEKYYPCGELDSTRWIFYDDPGGLEWLYKTKGKRFSKHDCSLAADIGAIQCLEWFHSWGTPWDKKTTYSAAARGNMRCLEFAIENGCPYDIDKLLRVTKSEEITRWLQSIIRSSIR